jgi:L-asparaginase
MSRRRAGPVRVAALVAVLASSQAQAQVSPAAASAAGLPHVHVIATGGTIAHTPDGLLTGDALLAALPGLERVARVTVEQFLNVGSSQITPEHWLGLALRIAGLLREQPELAGIVVTHGTDTLEETAFFLHLTVADPRPVVVTGAMRPARAPGADGPANLLAAIRVAADAAARGRPVLAVVGDEIHAAPAVAKAHTTRPDAFVSTFGGILGSADADGVAWHAPPAAGALRGAFPPAPAAVLPRVDVVYAYAGADGNAVGAAAAAGARGLVVAAVGRGNLPAALREAVARFAAEGGVVALASRTQAGRVPAEAAGVGGRVVAAGELNPQKARVLLMLALAADRSAARVDEWFRAF